MKLRYFIMRDKESRDLASLHDIFWFFSLENRLEVSHLLPIIYCFLVLTLNKAAFLLFKMKTFDCWTKMG